MSKIELMSTSEAATELGVSVATVTRWRLAKRLEPVYQTPGIRGAFMFLKQDVEALKTQLPDLGYSSKDHHETD